MEPRRLVRSTAVGENERSPPPYGAWTEATRVLFDSSRDELRRLHNTGHSLSPLDYPHAAEDIALAAETFLASRRGARGGAGVRPARLAVWSAISPWVEATLLLRASTALPVLRNASITTVDYNEPILSRNAGVSRLRTLAQGELPSAYARGERFDAIVSFSGLEHDGLGRYADPLNPTGDFSAMEELRHFLAPGGLLLLGLPTGAPDDIEYPWQRIYGPKRLGALLSRWELAGRVWNGTVVRGGLDEAWRPPVLFPEATTPSMLGWAPRWQHQPVLALHPRG